ncbi:cytochrome P450-like protein [Thermothelomyces heterothallicus CBS 202.75]|uniref:cytochrome P450-like protein n=1 Tax=Thermothelomyces heterothallicus CBS 202.75 TaxID=1149848 RepID=UPI003743C0B9
MTTFSIFGLERPAVLALSIAVGASFVIYLVTITIHRLFFHRISHIPGPKLAALTYYYQSYYDFFPHQGQFIFKLEELHRKYGPIVRIGPDEVHVNDAKFYKEMYGSSTHKRNKSPIWYWMHGLGAVGDQSMFITLDHDHHRLRKAGLGTYFSKRKVQELEPRVREKVLLLRQRLLERAGGAPVNLKDAFGGMALDIITQYCFNRCFGALDRPDLGREMNKLMGVGVKINPFARTFPTLARTVIKLPRWALKWSGLVSTTAEFLDIADRLSSEARNEAIRDLASGKYSRTDDADSRTVLHSMMRSDVLPEHEKTEKRLQADGMTLIAAGFDTTSRTLTVIFYHLLTKAHIRARVLDEIRTLMPTPTSPLPTVAQLEQLRYLTCVIHEGTRLAHGVAGRLVRIAPEEDLEYHSPFDGRRYTIPRGTTFGQSSYLVHTDESIYPNAAEFDPDRYWTDDGKPTDAQRYLVPFGKGTRMCVGINLAWAELYLTIAALVGTVDMRIAPGTTEHDVTMVQDLFVGVLPENPGVRVNVVGHLQA